MTIKGKAYIAGIYEHPTRHAPDKSTAQLHAEVAKGAIEDAGLTKDDIDGYFCAGDAPGGLWPMVDYLGFPHQVVQAGLILFLAIALFSAQKWWVFCERHNE